MTLPRKLYKMNPRVQEKDTWFWFDGVLKLNPLDEFVFLTVLPRPWHRPGKLKRGPMALLRALYKMHPRELKSVAYFPFSGASKMNP